jgi:chromosomal replication initiation ATPase DnaA
MSIADELRQIRKRLDSLEAAAQLVDLRGTLEDEQILAEACQQIRISMATVQSSSRVAEVVRARSFLACNLHRRMGWSVPRIAKVMRKEQRGVWKMILRTV